MNLRHPKSKLRIASYNVRKARGLDGKRDPMRIISVINALDADVVALQEADRRLGDRPAAISAHDIAAETDFELVPAARNDVSLGWHGNAILARKGTKVDHIAHIQLPGLEPRGAVGITLRDGTTIVGAHLGLARSSRRKQLAAIVEHLGQPSRAIIMGDMNEWSRRRGFEALTRDFDVHAPGRSFHAARPIAALDRIALTRDIALTDAGVAETPLAKRASDHLPIWADVETASSL